MRLQEEGSFFFFFLLYLNKRICEEALQPSCSHIDSQHDIKAEDVGAKR